MPQFVRQFALEADAGRAGALLTASFYHFRYLYCHSMSDHAAYPQAW
jgi:hypothetical protein